MTIMKLMVRIMTTMTLTLTMAVVVPTTTMAQPDPAVMDEELERLRAENTELGLKNQEAESQRGNVLLLLFGYIAALVAVAGMILLRMSRRHIKALNAKNEEIMAALARAERSDQLKSKFIENISHEIRTPLNAIVGFAELLTTPAIKFTDEERAEFCQTISKNSGVLTAIVNEMIDISEMQSGIAKPVMHPCRCNDTCHVALNLVEAKKPEGVALTFTTDLDDTDTLVTDQHRLTQVLFHFLTNAEKFTHHGSITLDCSRTLRPGYVTFTVTDTGCGIPKEKQVAVFEQFEKNDKMEQGVGLGLSLCTMIARLLKADIGIDPTYTSGARFYFALPRE